MSLLEILVTLFILSVGLLGVAAILPLGNHAVKEAMKADRSSTCGRAMMREMKIRGWVDPRMWIGSDGTDWRPVVTPSLDGPVIPYASSFVIDPLFLGEQGSPVGPADTFPARFDTLMPAAPLRRVTINVGVTGMSLPVANQHFVWHDDLLLPAPKDSDDRPRQTMLWSNGEGSAWPYRMADGPDMLAFAALKAEDAGNYSWLATVTPIIDPFNNNGGLSLVNRITQYSVSIVVFYKRDLRWPDNASADSAVPPAERSVLADMTFGGGWGGGDVQLVTDQGAHWLNVRKDQWIMLRAVDSTGKVVCNWYRVIAVDPEVDLDSASGTWGRYVTLSGPDWQVAAVTHATLIDNVIGVYTTTVEADLNSAWTR